MKSALLTRVFCPKAAQGFNKLPIHKILVGLYFLMPIGESANAQLAISSPSQRALATPADLRANDELKAGPLRTPYHFNVPFATMLPVPGGIVRGVPGSPENPVVVFDYVNSDPQSFRDREVGLRLLGALDQNRRAAAKALAESGMIQDGDIILSYRPNWYGTIRYGSVQLGVSHSGFLYIDSDGLLKNLDLPLDPDHVGANNYLSSEHYKSTNFYQVLRPRLTAEQRRRVKAWIQLFKKQSYPSGRYRRLITFNSNYGAPSFGRLGMSLIESVAKVGVTGRPMPESFKLFCSEFLWAILALKDCDVDPATPQSDEEAIRAGTASCIDESKIPFQPMPMLGDGDNGGTPGMLDGAPIVMEGMGLSGPARAEALDLGVFRQNVAWKVWTSANPLDPNIIGTNHQKVEKEMAAGYVQISLRLLEKKRDELVRQGQPVPSELGQGIITLNSLSAARGDLADIERTTYLFDDLQKHFDRFDAEIEAKINMLQMDPQTGQYSLNYGPASFMVHGQLRFNNPGKALDYVGTIIFIKEEAKYKKLKIRASE